MLNLSAGAPAEGRSIRAPKGDGWTFNGAGVQAVRHIGGGRYLRCTRSGWTRGWIKIDLIMIFPTEHEARDAFRRARAR